MPPPATRRNPYRAGPRSPAAPFAGGYVTCQLNPWPGVTIRPPSGPHFGAHYPFAPQSRTKESDEVLRRRAYGNAPAG